MAKNNTLKKQPSKTTKNLSLIPPDYNSCKPEFSFYHMEYLGRHSLFKCLHNDKCSAVDKLIKISQITWYQIFSSHCKGNGQEQIPVHEFKVSLPEFVTPETKKLMVFHHSGAGRIAGIKEGATYHVLLVGDQLYDH